VKCNEQAERQLRKAKPPNGKLSILRGKRSVVLEHGYHGTVCLDAWIGIDGMISVLILWAEIIPLWKTWLIKVWHDTYAERIRRLFDCMSEWRAAKWEHSEM